MENQQGCTGYTAGGLEKRNGVWSTYTGTASPDTMPRRWGAEGDLEPVTEGIVRSVEDGSKYRTQIGEGTGERVLAILTNIEQRLEVLGKQLDLLSNPVRFQGPDVLNDCGVQPTGAGLLEGNATVRLGCPD